MMANDFIDDETQKLFGEIGIQFGIAGKLAKPGNLFLFAHRVCWRQAGGRLIFAHSLRHFEPFRKHEDQRRIYVVDAVAITSKFVIVVHGNRFAELTFNRQAILQLLHLQEIGGVATAIAYDCFYSPD